MNQTFHAGPQGSEIKSDCHISYSPGSKPLEIRVWSKVQALFSQDIETRILDTCQAFGISTGSIEINDYGALPFVLMAHLETVIKRAHPNLDIEVLPEMKAHAQYETSRRRFRRSRLYLPGNQPKLFLNAGIHRPDAIILDLEDSVPPSEKDAARNLVRNALRSLDFFGAERMVRINQGELGMLDLEAVVPQNVHVIIIPKAESAKQLQAVEQKISTLRQAHHISQPVFLLPILESALGVMNAYEIATASDLIIGLSIGLEDYTADLGTPRTESGQESLFARSMLVNAAKAAGIQAMASVYSDVSNHAGLIETALEAKALGFEGMGCIHPRQIQPIHDSFAPSHQEISSARVIVKAADEATAKGLGVVAVGSKMIDPPVVIRAERIIQLAIDAGLLPGDWEDDDQSER